MAMALPAPPEPARGGRGRRAEQEILARGHALLRCRPYRGITVDEVMAGTTLSRPAFYQYFRDIDDLVLRLLDRSGDYFMNAARPWLEGGDDPERELRETIGAMVRSYDEEGAVVVAVADAARGNPAVQSAYNMRLDEFIDAYAERIQREIDAGRVRPLDAREAAAALGHMTVAYVVDRLGRTPPVDQETVVETLVTMWMRALFCVNPGERPCTLPTRRSPR